VVPREHDPLTQHPLSDPGYGVADPGTESGDPHGLLFGSDDEYGGHDGYGPVDGHPHQPRRVSRVQRRRRRRNRRTFVVLSGVLVVVLAVVGFVGYTAYQNRYHPKDWTGQGTGTVQIVIHPGDSAANIGKTLVSAGVVRTSRAFSNAASKNSLAQALSPGTYQVRKHMSASAALTLLLEPTSRLSNDVVVFPGATVFDVATAMAKSLNISTAAATAALQNVSALGLPSGYTSGQTLGSVEGFLYPATYTFDPGTKPTDAVQEMITKFIDEDRNSGFSAQAKAAHLTPYEALIIASIAEKEAKNPNDYAKVARVILNRIAQGMPLQIDATSAYAAKLKHLDPTKVIYNQIDSPYNTYTHKGLPPTPIANPGTDATTAAVHPAAGNWLYYVNADAKGNLFFTNDPNAFDQAVQKCRDNNWGCG
jgi:UPF0755 protein